MNKRQRKKKAMLEFKQMPKWEQEYSKRFDKHFYGTTNPSRQQIKQFSNALFNWANQTTKE